MSDLPLLAAALDSVSDPVSGRGLLASGRASAPRLEGGRADVIVDVAGLAAVDRTALEAAVRAALLAVPGVSEARILLTADRPQRRIIAVASGKGGVGKSTVAANIAVALARRGVKVGLVDADIYGPSQPRLFDAHDRPDAKDKIMFPVPTRWGVPILSMGQLIEPGKAIAWRGPMAAGALSQLVDAHWGQTDVLILDLPPGTGDVQLTMIQKHRPVGAVIVSTPQDLALIDATRAIDLFFKAEIPIVGLVENMAGYACPHCGEISDPFGQGGAEAEAAALGLPFLGRIPLARGIRTASDAGMPPAAGDGPDAAPFHAIAAQIETWLNPSASPVF
ncbi:Mrp/NBP35 family ATP-binding protein [Sphingomonas sp. AP4-R1]|uniref:Mrp/NBP35 family ATP-binding protein n=1 Tax=Sphingomonas sp. AP4-R1 TaxID=2735134 RepID=UPI0014935EDB|nr:Mrp/NBP35 family ATP-binding protein [Sphingomonas sp. AP4-R1]QJU56673.1 Mrp/NBP35 family ATP-binding protein [Sphingomonas sp. AP4-R1]